MSATRADLASLTVLEAAALIRSRKVSPVELTQACLDRIEAWEPVINAFITVTADQALEAARAHEKMIAAGYYLGPLHGVPIGLKDNVLTAGVRSTAGSKILADNVPDADATVVSRLRQAGAVVLGKLNMHEFAWGGTTDNPHYGPTRNPWDPSRFPAGSSGGSGAAVAAREVLGALGTDTGGSIRLPSAVNGCVGIRPTIGRVSNFNVIPLAWSMDTVGPMARTVDDVATMLSVIAGYDPNDEGTDARPVPDYSRGIGDGVRGLGIGVVSDYFFSHLQEPVRKAVSSAIDSLVAQGAVVREVEIANIRAITQSCGSSSRRGARRTLRFVEDRGRL
jgi:aspartyl-tRNA(Asn)/glutamyl-tRNA(Gln) amidotransferase subunit A